MADYSLRSEVLRTDLVKDIKYITSMQFFNPHIAEELQDSLQLLRDENPLYFDEAVRIIKSDYARHTRLKNKVKKLMSMGQCLFLTFTFTDEVLNSTSIKTRRTYVTRVLKHISDNFIANIDYGSQTQREHYHAIVVADFFDRDCWPYGFSYVKVIRDSSSPLAMAKYISKLTNHAIKESARRPSIIYSRKTETAFSS